MSLLIQGIGLAQPRFAVPQAELAAAAMPCSCQTEAQRKLLATLYRRSRVEQRHSVVVGGEAVEAAPLTAASTGRAGPVAGPGAQGAAPDDAERRERMLAFYPPAASDRDRGPSIATRMRRYPQEALPLAASACRAALADAAVHPHDIDQLVVVTCTGFSAPGVDIGLIESLGLRRDVGRTLVGFMGCHGAMNGLRVAGALAGAVESQVRGRAVHWASGGGLRGGRVLMCCVELCTLHFQYGWDPQRVVANALFADGAAAVVGTAWRSEAATSDGEPEPPRVTAHGSLLLPDSTDAMSWVIRDHGFEMTLSPRVPDLIQTHLRGWLEPWLEGRGLDLGAVGGWAIHPGGPRVISSVEEALDLPPGAGDAARDVLRACGNMSSPTVLFIVDRLRRANVPRPWVALAFGPGLTIEAAVIV